MKTFPWIIAGVAVGFAAYLIVTGPASEYSTGNDDVEGAARRTFGWGARQRVTGAGGSVAGKLKEGVGRLTGDDSLAGEGIVDQLASAAKDTAGSVAQAVGETIHDLNR